MIQKFRKKPVEVEAVQWTGSNVEEIRNFVGSNASFLKTRDNYYELYIKTLEDNQRSKHFASQGDWIIKGVKGEFYPCKPEIFEQSYDVV